MALNSSGPISLGGATQGQSVNLEVGAGASSTIAFNDTSVRTLTSTSAGTTLTMPTNFYGKSLGTTVQYLLVGGGGGGQNVACIQGGGGGGGGGVLTGSLTASKSITVTIGTGGVSGGAGGNTAIVGCGITTTTAIGGGYGGSGNGGSGGGACGAVTASGGTGTVGQGYAGGNTTAGGAGGGGGGAGAAGGAGCGTAGGNGGVGISSSITGAATYYGGGGGAGGGTLFYSLNKSLRFRNSASAYLNRTFSGNGTGGGKTWTLSAWVKLGNPTINSQNIFSADNGSQFNRIGFGINSGASNSFEIGSGTSAVAWAWSCYTTAVYRDPSAWYHFVVAFDSTQGTSTNRVKLYVNGVQQTLSGSFPTQNTIYGWGYNGGRNLLGVQSDPTYGLGPYLDGYMAEVNFIDGQQLTPTSFGSFSSVTGVWQPARYTGTYGTNGFYLSFANTTSTTTLGYDTSGNSNNWTPNNISLTAGVTYDSMNDVPTLTSSTVSNYPVMNPITGGASGASYTISNANMYVVLSSSANVIGIPATVAMTTGSYYWEVTVVSTTNVYSYSTALGITTQGGIDNGTNFNSNGSYLYTSKLGYKLVNGTFSAYGASYTNGDIIGIAFNATAGTIEFYKNGTSQGVISGIAAGTWFPLFGSNGDCTVSANFGQQPFVYTSPSGYIALNTYNLPNSTILTGNQYMDATIWTGDGTTPKSQTNTAGFKPDLVWIKNRSNGYSHNLYDSVRGAGSNRDLQSNTTNSESTNASDTALYGYLSAFNSNGFSTTNGTDPTYSSIWVNASGQNFVGWQWSAGSGTTSTNTSGTITSTTSVNSTSGFSIITYTGNGVSGATVGHGLGVAPTFWIIKRRDGPGSWKALSTVTGSVLMGELNTQTTWASPGSPMTTVPTSSVITLDSSGDRNGSGQTYVIYAWTPIPGYSAITYFNGNGSTDGPFIHTGFRPKFTLSKDIDGGSYWGIVDSVRSPYNVTNALLDADVYDAESATQVYDYLSNGIKLRSATNNQNNHRHIMISFAENPFKNALAR